MLAGFLQLLYMLIYSNRYFKSGMHLYKEVEEFSICFYYYSHNSFLLL